MAENYARGKPLGNNNVPMYDSPPAVKAVKATVKESTTTTSSILILTQDTTAIEVGAMGGPAFIRWLTQATVDSSVAGTSVIATGTGSNFDNMVPAATVRRFVVPIASIPNSSSSIQGANQLNGLFTHVAYIGTASSVLTIAEYGSSNSY